MVDSVHFVAILPVVDEILLLVAQVDVAPGEKLSKKSLAIEVIHERRNWVAKRTDCSGGDNRG